ncbi:MAG TPA: sigma 54-interacting transcriptional regulator [Polyangiaceae bacterium]|jgi:DNA-binding NtrC family response regulator
MTDDTASIPDGEVFRAPPDEIEMADALVIVWAGEEWARLGEVAFFRTLGRVLSIGREGTSPAGHERAEWVRQVPGENRPTPPLASRATSRDHLLVTARVYGLEVECLGKVAMFFRGEKVTRCRMEPGDYVIIDGQFIFRYTRRPVRLPALKHFPMDRAGAFGEANDFGIVCATPEMWELLDRAAFAALMPDHVMVRGETGSGKEAIAAMIHKLGPNAAGPYVTLSVGNLPRTLVEAELFGNRKDYPQAGMDARKGAVGEANGGSLGLDEIGSMAFDAQAALLRVLDHGEYHVLGSTGHMKSHFKLLALMNRPDDSVLLDLRKRFTITVWVPTLMARRDDVPLILRHLLRLSHGANKSLTERFVTKQVDGTEEVVAPIWFMERLLQDPMYEGNVRDLKIALNDLLHPSGLPKPQSMRRSSVAPPAGAPRVVEGEAAEARGATLTKEEVEWCLAKAGGSVKTAAELAGCTRQAFYRAMKRTGVTGKEGE